MTHGEAIDRALERLVRDASGQVLAILVRITGDLGLAEEVVQEALVVALTRWPTAGVPDDPRAWVITTARNLAIDRIRRRRRFDERSRVLGELASLRAPANPEEAMGAYPDERLRLLFTCCHPALDAPSRVALTLRTVGGLTSDEIARAFLVSRTTMQQRLVRAKKKIAAAGIPYAVPDPAHLEERLSGVLAVVYLIFNEGYGPTAGDEGLRVDLAEEAIHLGRVLHGLRPDNREVAGLLALMLLQHARRDARFHDGEVVLLEEQDRSQWDGAAIAEGRRLAAFGVEGRPGPYALQAAIAAVHAEATTYEATDWAQIELLYRHLRARVPSPVVALNHAVAIAMAHGDAAGLAVLESLEGELAGHHLFHCARGALWMRSGSPERAREAYASALETVGNGPERRFVERRLAALAV
ncbi:MAG: sigma-70 family RNA polymerase sigma factor [Alphaproteobacteria bacterium]|nr:sigma-70 family RNA polymerase sigma factor [Alphaproteobacteria bacterium]